MKNIDTEELISDLKTSKDYLDKLIEGINPVNGKPISPKEVIYDYKVSRQLEFLSDYIKMEIKNLEDKNSIGQNSKDDDVLDEFEITNVEKLKFEKSEVPLTMADICNKLNALRTSSKMRKLKGISAIEVLQKYGMITRENRKVKATEKGAALGIITKEIISNGQANTRVLYDKNAQQFILDKIDEIIEVNKTKRF
jgi:hypothetical protein